MTIGWTTHKNPGTGGYRAVVYSVEYQQPVVTLKTAAFLTRDTATAYAKKWTLYFRQAA